jgi:hypothetical protein
MLATARRIKRQMRGGKSMIISKSTASSRIYLGHGTLSISMLVLRNSAIAETNLDRKRIQFSHLK